NAPAYDFTASDGIEHRIWVVNDDATIAQISELFQQQVPCTYIADGHHRAASAAKVRRSLEAGYPDGANYFLTTLFAANQLYIMDYNRVVKDLNGHSEAGFLSSLAQHCSVEKVGAAISPASLHEFGMYLGGQWYKLTAKEGSYRTDPIGVLDVTILSEKVL